MRRSSSSSRPCAALSPPAPGRGHRTESDASPPPFRRLNQDCVDVIVEYAVCSVEAVLQLRRVSQGIETGLVNFFTLLVGHGPLQTFSDQADDAATFAPYFRTLGYWRDGKLQFLRALYGSPLAGFKAVSLTSQNDPSGCVSSFARRFPMMRVCCLGGAALTDEDVAAVAENCPELSALSLSCCPSVSGVGLTAIAFGCPKLKLLMFAGMVNILCGTVMGIVGRRCPELTLLEFRFCNFTSCDGSLHRNSRSFSGLESLSFFGCHGTRLADAAVAFVEACPLLGSVVMQQAELDSARPLAALAHKCPLLECLDLAMTDASEDSVMTIARNCRRLTSLNISETPALTNAALKEVAIHCRQLRYLEARRCRAGHTAFEGSSAIAQQCSNLRMFAAPDGRDLTACQRTALERCRPTCEFDFGQDLREPE